MNRYSKPSLKIDFSSSEKIIQRAKAFRSISYHTMYKKKEKKESTFLTENKNLNNQKILPYINFNSNLSNYLRNSNLGIYSNRSVSNFIKKNRIKWKFNYINNLCKNLIKSHEKNNFFEKINENAKKSKYIYEKYKNDIGNYLLFLNNVKKKEEDFIFELISQKKKIVNSIIHLNEKIIKIKEIRNKGLNIKNFLLAAKKEYMNNLIITPIKEIKKKFDIIQTNEVRKTPKKTRSKFILESNNIKISTNYSSKNLSISNQKNFPTPDEFMNIFEEKLIKIRNKFNYYNITIYNNNIIRLKKDKEQNMINESRQKRQADINNYLSKLNILKKTNIELKTKLDENKNIEKVKNKGFKNLEVKLRNVILNIYSSYNFKEKCLTNFKSIYKVLDSNKPGKNKNLYLLKLLEQLINLVFEQDRKYKEDPKLKYLYIKIKLEYEQIKFELIRKRKLYKISQKEIEKSKKILEHHRKIRIIPFNKNGINLNYYHKINHLSISAKKSTELTKKENNKKNEEIINLICYN